MDLGKAIKRGYTMKFKPPDLGFCIGELKLLDEMFSAFGEEVELSVHAVDGIYGILDRVGEELREIAEKQVARQIDEYAEEHEEERDTK
ncbi:MAG: hypothetical protein JRJ03_08730 [Deltaproteobacteria bacterium]|nr:hypothetical protein [Deltaproteobacteria bacterium]